VEALVEVPGRFCAHAIMHIRGTPKGN
jgi:hypothetical protein